MEKELENKKEFLKKSFIFSKENLINCRVFALIIDILIVLPLAWLITAPIVSLAINLKIFKFLDANFHNTFNLILICLIFIIYSAIFESSYYRATIGQIFFKIKIKSIERKKISFLQGIKRGILKLISSPIVITFIPLLLLMELLIIPLKENLIPITVEKR